MDYLLLYHRAIKWIHKNSINGEAIICNSSLKKGYPEVTGYYIPSLLRWGYKDLAASYAKWLCEIQKEDGSWYDTDDKAPYIFDSAQVLKGLLAMRELKPEVDANILKGCDWIISRMDSDGRLITPTKDAWGDDKGVCDEVIHLYCVSPLIEAGKLFDKDDYLEAAKKISAYYMGNYEEKIFHFDLLSHFHAYVMEALVDLGEYELAEKAMKEIEKITREDGSVPAYNHVNWVCSTGMFQLAIVWYRLGNIDQGNKTFSFACKLQNETGGWYGRYPYDEGDQPNYFSHREISWANKFFLDALYYKNQAEFEDLSNIFMNTISESDGRYQFIYTTIKAAGREGIKVLEAGCGKGRYLKNLLRDLPNNEYTAIDLSKKVMQFIENKNIVKKQGSLTDIPFGDGQFDVAYACESLEHAIDIERAVSELARIVRKGGMIIIIDKNREMLGNLEIMEWEQWFGDEELKSIMERYCDVVTIEKDLPYEDHPSDGLFYAWCGRVK